MASGWAALTVLLAVMVAWTGLALIMLARRVIELEERLQGERIMPLSFEIGDRVPTVVVGESVGGRPAQIDLHSRSWLLIFVTEGCSACHRTVEAASLLSERFEALSLAVLIPRPQDIEPVSNEDRDREVQSNSVRSWLSELTPNAADRLLMLSLKHWSRWGVQGTPTTAIVRDGKVTAIDIGLSTSKLLSAFLRSNGFSDRMPSQVLGS